MANLERADPCDRKLRIKALLDRGSALGTTIETESTLATINAINNIILESDEIIDEGNVDDRAEHTAEVVMDAQLLKMSHQLVSKVMEAETDFNDAIYQNALSALVFRDDNDNWGALTDIAVAIAHTTKFSASMLGSFDPNIPESQKVIKDRQKRKNTKNNAEQLQPERVTQLEKQDKGAKKVEIIYKQIVEAFEANNRLPIPYFKIIIDPNSFMNTVENAFQISFLARDDKIAIETGEDNLPHLRVTNKKEKELVASTNQSICSINLEICKEMITFYDIFTPMLHVE